ncbi:MAG TPA: DUF6351 family protein [Nevskiaceae bacterium]|nr:DUF6351 family protein [Nevskiaceae bacterium]
MNIHRLSLLGLALGLAACGGSLPGSIYGKTAPDSSSALAIKVLSNRADLISGNDALVEVVPPAGVSAADLAITLDGADIASEFIAGADGHAVGLVTGLKLGANHLAASGGGQSDAVTIVNHAQGGPVFAGPQLQPWTCRNTDAKDAQCNQDPVISWMYKSSSPAKSGLQSYDPNNPPTDVASTTTDNGTTVPFIVRIETGYQDRDQYAIAALYQPDQAWSAAAPQPQFNHKLLITHGVSCGVDYQTGTAPSVTTFNPIDVTGAGLPAVGGDSVEYALGAGFAVMSTALDYSGHNCNVALQAESLMMAKEHLIENYGTLRYTIGTGCSGGSLAQQWIANAYPGIYQGILPTCSFPDAWGTATQFADYHLLLAYFEHPGTWGTGVIWNPEQMADVEGHVTIVNSLVSDNAQFHVAIPTDTCAGISDAQRYDPNSNPGGVRCDVQDAAINLLGPRPPELWSAQEQQIGHGFAGFPVDNVGVQYGLRSLQNGLITPDQFVDLNLKIGGLDQDTNAIAQRTAAVQPALANAYRSGLINETNNMDQVAIIDCRGPDPGAFHDAYRAFAVRARLDREHGNHDNQMIWEGPVPIIGDAQCSLNSLQAMDGWLAAVEQDGSSKLLAQKIVADKPSDISDECYDGAGQMLTSSLCPVVAVPGYDDIINVGVVPIYGTPRMVAGDDISTDANKCQLKPLDRSDNYGVLPFSDAQWAQLQALYPDGVCDFSKPGVSQQGTIPWQTYQDDSGAVIYGGTALPAAPAHSGSGWASPAFGVFGGGA